MMTRLLTVRAATIRERVGSCIAAADGQTLVEYSLILFLIALGVIVAIGALSGELNTFFHSVVNNL